MVILREIAPSEKGMLLSSLENMAVQKENRKDRQERIGIGVDIGTTTIVVYLWDFYKGKLFRTLSRENCQTRLGTDVMMRIMHAVRGKQEELHQMLVNQIEQMMEILIEDWQREENISLNQKEVIMSVVGNPTMCHFFLDKEVTGLAGAPFQSAYTGNNFCDGNEVGFRHRKQMRITVLSGIAAHVGSDALALLGMMEQEGEHRTKLIVDLGTNAEMILIDKGALYCCSTAAGPALEGKGISCGVRAKSGAVTGVKLAPRTGNIVLEYLSGEMPIGITGTGLLELMEGMCRCGILTSQGYLLEGEEAKERGVHPELAKCLITRKEERAFLLYHGEKDLLLSQNDIRNIQLAKGAILAGIQCLLKACRLSAQEVEEVVVAGALGNHLREETVIRLGLFPSEFRGKLFFVGNGAGMGAVRMLTQAGFSSEMERKAREITHVELAEKKEFQTCMMQGMELKEFNAKFE